MGSCTHYGSTLNEAIDEEAGFKTGENKLIARGAGGGDFSAAYGGWQGSVWIVAENRNGERWLAQVLYSYGSRGSGWDREKNVTIKWVEESMGPGDLDVPANVWKARPAEAPNEYARSWRHLVEQFQATYPQLVRKLGPEDEGKNVYIHGHDSDGPWVYRGAARKGVMTFDAPDYHRYRLPASEQRLRRCRVEERQLISCDPRLAS
jgi:hypothetical protein